MGVDYYPCTNCGETFPDCGEYHTCGHGHMLCAYCMRKVPEADKERDGDGYFNSKHCPTCAKGGSERQRLAKADLEVARLRTSLQSILDLTLLEGDQTWYIRNHARNALEVLP